MIPFAVSPLASELADVARTNAHDAYGNALRIETDGTENAPCRVCLTRAREGDAMILFSHSPFNPLKTQEAS